MKRFAILCWDAPGAAPAREATRAAHFAHIETVLDRLSIAGPLKNEAGGYIGSLLIVTADSAADARVFLEADPYFTAGIWGRIEISEFVAAAGEWIGGKIW